MRDGSAAEGEGIGTLICGVTKGIGAGSGNFVQFGTVGRVVGVVGAGAVVVAGRGMARVRVAMVERRVKSVKDGMVVAVGEWGCGGLVRWLSGEVDVAGAG